MKLLKFVGIGFVTLFCLSAQNGDLDEVVMTKCTKENPSFEEGKCYEEPDCGTCKKKPRACMNCGGAGDCNCSNQQSDGVQVVKTKRKGAAQKVVDGE